MYKKIEIKKINDLRGHILSKIENIDNRELIFTLENGRKYRLYHSQNCCEDVTIEDICGNLEDLIGLPLCMAEEVGSLKDYNAGLEAPSDSYSFTWTFYKFATNKGYVTIRWYGESNGYYSESVDFCEIKGE